jgi:hypothetical protein
MVVWIQCFSFDSRGRR